MSAKKHEYAKKITFALSKSKYNQSKILGGR